MDVLGNLELIISNLDSIKQTIDQLDQDLENSIQKTQESKQKIDYFIDSLEKAQKEIEVFSGNISSGRASIGFKDTFPVKENPVFLVFPFVIAIIISFTSIILSNMFILKQVSRPSYLKDIIAPSKDINFLLADYLVNLFFISIQAGVLFLIGFYWFGISPDTIFIYVLAIFLTASIFIFIGMAFGYFIKSQNVSMLLTIFFLMVLLILSNLIAPILLAGQTIRFFIDSNPFAVISRILIDSLILNKPLPYIMAPLLRLFIFFIISILIAYISRKVSKKKVME